MFLGEQDVVGVKTVVVVWVAVSWVEDHHLVKQRSAGPPVAEDEDRRLVDAGAGDGFAVERVLGPTENHVPEGDGGGDHPDVQVPEMEVEAPSHSSRCQAK